MDRLIGVLHERQEGLLRLVIRSTYTAEAYEGTDTNRKNGTNC